MALNGRASNKETRTEGVRARLICPPAYKDKFLMSTCIVGVSVGQLAHEGVKFEETIKCISRRFKNCIIAVSDSLQRHSLSIGTQYSAEELHEEANKKGKAWVSRNSHILQRATIPIKIYHWDKWLLRHDYKLNHEMILQKYKQNSEFKSAMDKTIADYIVRLKGNFGCEGVPSNAIANSFDYLAEECAIVMLMWQEIGVEFVVYTSDILPVMRSAHNLFVDKKSGLLLEWVRIKLKTKTRIVEKA